MKRILIRPNWLDAVPHFRDYTSLHHLNTVPIMHVIKCGAVWLVCQLICVIIRIIKSITHIIKSINHSCKLCPCANMEKNFCSLTLVYHVCPDHISYCSAPVHLPVYDRDQEGAETGEHVHQGKCCLKAHLCKL